MRGAHGSVDTLYVIADRDSEIGGGLMAGALAYRIFIWLLPFALVIVGGIGIAASASESPEDAAQVARARRDRLALGCGGHGRAPRGGTRSLIGIPLLLWATRSLLKAVVVVHRLVWGDPRRTVPKPTLAATASAPRLPRGLLRDPGARALGRDLDRERHAPDPRRPAPRDCAGGCWSRCDCRIATRRGATSSPARSSMAVGLELISDVGIYLIAPRVESSQSTYGALGLAATLLFGLYLVSRLVVASAVVNATVWERRLEGERGTLIGSRRLTRSEQHERRREEDLPRAHARRDRARWGTRCRTRRSCSSCSAAS